MNGSLSTTSKERIIAALLIVLGSVSLCLAFVGVKPLQIDPGELLLIIAFAACIALADYYPIHILRGTKVSLINLPIFLAAALLPAFLSVPGVGIGLLVSNLRLRVERGLLPRDIASTVGQWMFISFLGNRMMQLANPGVHSDVLKDVLLLLSVLIFLSVDFLVFSISQSYIFGESFVLTLKSLIKEGIILEVIQYSIAVLGVLAAYQSLWSLLLLIIPVVITYVAFKNLKETRYETVQILEDIADTVDLRDLYTGGHSKRVADLVHQVLVRLNISGPEATLIETAARLHDIGKIGIADSILKKPGKLLPEERDVMQTHPVEGAKLISKFKDFSRGTQMILHHHERWDGDGYPAGLKADEIPFGSRIIAVADSFDAMTSDRPYRKALSPQQAFLILREGQDKQWDAKIVTVFLDLMTQQFAEGNPVVPTASETECSQPSAQQA